MQVGDKFEFGESYVEVLKIDVPNVTLRLVFFEDGTMIDLKEQTVPLKPSDFDEPDAFASRMKLNFEAATVPVALTPLDLVQ